jgi:hypothetical protein
MKRIIQISILLLILSTAISITNFNIDSVAVGDIHYYRFKDIIKDQEFSQ